MIILKGGNFASDFTMYNKPLDANQAYSFHSYNFLTNESDKANIEKLTEKAIAHNVPLWNGEFGAHRFNWVKEEIRLYEDPKYPINGWIFWPWKRVNSRSECYRALGEFAVSKEWEQVGIGIASIFGPGKEITPEIAKKAMADFIDSSKAVNLEFDQEMVALLKENLNH